MNTDKGFFVILNHPKCAPLIMTDTYSRGEDIAWFYTYESAKAAAQDNDLGNTFGYEIFQLGYGE